MRPALLLSCLFSVIGCVCLVGCADAFSPLETAEIANETSFDSSVRLPLAARTTDGKSFRLRNATFEITGPAMFTLTDKDAKQDADNLITILPAGQYSVFLRPGWELVEVTPDGTELAAAAKLGSDNPIPFTMGRTVDTRVKFTLLAGERAVVFGAPDSDRLTSAEPELTNAF